MKLTIDRRRWACKGHSKGMLYEAINNKKMCCLGFLARACGFKVSEIEGEGLFSGLECTTSTQEAIKTALSTNSRQATLIRANDHITGDWVRENMVASTMREMGIDVIFKGKYPKDGK